MVPPVLQASKLPRSPRQRKQQGDGHISYSCVSFVTAFLHTAKMGKCARPGARELIHTDPASIWSATSWHLARSDPKAVAPRRLSRPTARAGLDSFFSPESTGGMLCGRSIGMAAKRYAADRPDAKLAVAEDHTAVQRSPSMLAINAACM
jgi:hypothetical protein